MATRKVELVLTPAGHTCQVLLDGEEVKNCRRVTVNAEVGKATAVSFELINVEVVVTGATDDQDVRWSDVTSLTDSSRRYRNNTTGQEVTAEDIVTSANARVRA